MPPPTGRQLVEGIGMACTQVARHLMRAKTAMAYYMTMLGLRVAERESWLLPRGKMVMGRRQVDRVRTEYVAMVPIFGRFRAEKTSWSGPFERFRRRKTGHHGSFRPTAAQVRLPWDAGRWACTLPQRC